jgi:regulator of replication initiation timing
MATDPTPAAEARERVAKWIEETRQIFALIPELIAGDHHAGAAAQKEVDKLHKDIEDLKRENHLLRLEKDEIAQAMGQIAAKLGITPRRSPFERSGPGEHPRQPDHAKSPESPKAAEHPKAADPAKS